MSQARIPSSRAPARPGAISSGPPQVRLAAHIRRVGLAGLAVAGTVLEHGFDAPPIPRGLIHFLQVCLLVAYVLDVAIDWRLRIAKPHDTDPRWFDVVLMTIAASGVVIAVGVAPGGWLLFEGAVVALMMDRLWQLYVGLSRRFGKPGWLLPASFLTMIAVGTPLLKVPLAVPAGQDISWLDALFTITSAVCVTGLIVRDTATQFTPYGQTVIGVFIQLGGLNIIIFGSMLAMLLGNRLSLRQNVSLSHMLQDLPLRRVGSFVRFIVLTTLLCELAGAAALATMWDHDLPLARRLGLGLFHSISAFCNAGFSLQSDSLESFRYAPQVHLVIIPLLVIGGLGFPVLDNLWQTTKSWWRRRRSARKRASTSSDLATDRLSLHTKIVLGTTAALYLYGVVAITAGQLKPYTHDFFQQGITANRTELEPLNTRRIGAILADTSFMALTARTAGFTTVPPDQLSPAGRFVTLTLMMIGASPGGTGGGLKTTTLALLGLTVVATLRRRDHTEVFSRRISEPLVRKAAAIAACFVTMITAATLLLCFSEPFPFEKIVFEVVSAASTTGLSLGITDDLTAFGKLVIIVTMFLGRIGPLALMGGLLFRSDAPRPYAYAHENVVMG